MSELADVKKRIDGAIRALQLLRANVDVIHDCGYLSSGKKMDGTGRSQRYHYYGDEVGNRRWRTLWHKVRDFDPSNIIGLAMRFERLVGEGQPLTADEFNRLMDTKEGKK